MDYYERKALRNIQDYDKVINLFKRIFQRIKGFFE